MKLMEERICNDCKTKYTHYGQKTAKCRTCKRKYDREFHKKRSKDKKKHKLKLAKKRIIENRKKLYSFYLSNPCTICSESRVACLQLDHLNTKDKYKNIANMMDYSWTKIEIEINKCRVLCANCHSVHTAEQFGYYNFS
jgi:hypothetical protein